jgi:hypothetical protein
VGRITVQKIIQGKKSTSGAGNPSGGLEKPSVNTELQEGWVLLRGIQVVNPSGKSVCKMAKVNQSPPSGGARLRGNGAFNKALTRYFGKWSIGGLLCQQSLTRPHRASDIVGLPVGRSGRTPSETFTMTAVSLKSAKGGCPVYSWAVHITIGWMVEKYEY